MDRFPDLAVGDEVVIYETKSGPRRWLTFPDGTRRRSHYKPGREAVVAVGRVVRLTPDHPVTRAEHEDEDRVIDWVQLAELTLQRLDTPVPRVTMNRALGRKPNAYPRGFGGLLRLTAEQFAAIVVR